MRRSGFLCLPALLAALSAAVVSAPPAPAFEVILVRHADKDTSRGDYNLSPAGFARAIALARIIPACLGAPSGILTFVLDPSTSKNARSYQSAVPLAVATGVPIRIALDSIDQSERIGQELRRQYQSSSQRLVLFWEHRRMPDLARGLGWDGMAAIADDDFDGLFLFQYPAGGGPPSVQSLRQSLLSRRPCFSAGRSPVDEALALPCFSSRP